MLVWFEQCGDINLAVQREKQMKEWKRLWKLQVIEEMNPDWNDLYESCFECAMSFGATVIPAQAGTQTGPMFEGFAQHL